MYSSASEMEKKLVFKNPIIGMDGLIKSKC